MLSSQSASDEDEVEWAELSSGWDSARSPYHLRNKWACLRRSIPSYHSKTFQGKDNRISAHHSTVTGMRLQVFTLVIISENLDYLLEFRLPSLERKFASNIVQDDSDSD